MTEVTLTQKQKRGNKKTDNLLRYHRYANLARSYGDLQGKVTQRRESERIKEKFFFLESMEDK
jgi:hypothetical protein